MRHWQSDDLYYFGRFSREIQEDPKKVLLLSIDHELQNFQVGPVVLTDVKHIHPLTLMPVNCQHLST